MISEDLIDRMTKQAVMRSYFPEYPDLEDYLAVREEITAGLYAFYEELECDENMVMAYRKKLENARKGKTWIERHNEDVKIEKAVFFYQLNYTSREIRERIKETPGVNANESVRAFAKIEGYGEQRELSNKAIVKLKKEWIRQTK